eukprot:316725-Pelagomonas_calceolata.AAC.2
MLLKHADIIAPGCLQTNRRSLERLPQPVPILYAPIPFYVQFESMRACMESNPTVFAPLLAPLEESTNTMEKPQGSSQKESKGRFWADVLGYTGLSLQPGGLTAQLSGAANRTSVFVLNTKREKATPDTP